MTSQSDAPDPFTDVVDDRQVRTDLAACYRLVAHFGMDDLIFTHITARVPGRPAEFLINPYGSLFHEIRASDLVRVTHDGTVADLPAKPVNPAGMRIHCAIHEARPDIACIIHTHSVAGIAVAAQAHGLLPISQHAMKFHNRIGYHNFEGIVLSPEEAPRLVVDLGPHQAMILRNHGLLAVGRTIAEAFHVIYHLEMACRVQVASLGGGQACLRSDAAVAEATARQFESFPQPLGQREWPALLRLADRLDPSYRL